MRNSNEFLFFNSQLMLLLYLKVDRAVSISFIEWEVLKDDDWDTLSLIHNLH